MARYMSGAAWRRMEEGRILLRLPQRLRPLLGLLRCAEPFSFHRTVGPLDMALLRAPGTAPYLAALPSFVQSFPLCLLVFLSPAFSLQPLTPLSLPGAPLPSRACRQTRHRAVPCRRSHLTQCGTTWLITNPIVGAPCVSRVVSVLLSHFIRVITGHFPFLVVGLCSQWHIQHLEGRWRRQ